MQNINSTKHENPANFPISETTINTIVTQTTNPIATDDILVQHKELRSLIEEPDLEEESEPELENDIETEQENNPQIDPSAEELLVNNSVISSSPAFSFSETYNYAPGRVQRYIGLNSAQYNYQQPAFSVINNADDLANYYTSNSAYSFGKPNAIVHPIRRTEPFRQKPQLAHNVSQDIPDPNRQQNDPNYQQQQNGDLEHGQQKQQTVAPATRSMFSRSIQEVRSFADELKNKLKFLNTEEQGVGSWLRSRHNGGQDTYNGRPRFVTTVPTGIFLPPPKELENLPDSVLRRQVYAYSSYPFVFNPYNNNIYTTTNHNNNNNNSYNYNNYGRGFNTYAKDKTRTAKIVTNAPEITSSTTTTATIAGTDKNTKANATHLNGIKGHSLLPKASTAQTTTPTTDTKLGPNAHSTAKNIEIPGEVHITKEQFKQQVQQRRAKREVIPPPEPYLNVMYDKRVVKGSNFAGATLITDVDPFDKAAELRRRNTLRKRTIQCRNPRNVIGTPPPIKGRRHEEIQTEKYLEKLVARPPEYSVDTQTDLFLEKPPTPPYIPAKIGIDVGTEIDEGELFHFEAEAQPIIDVLVDACIEQSMLEVAHEMELDALRRKQEEYLAQREAELAELRRLEDEEYRLKAEKERRLRQDAIAKELDEEMQKSVTAAKLLQGHIASLVPEVLANIEPASDAVKKEQLMNNICPWLSAEVAEEVGHIVDSREILTAIIQEIIKQRAENYIGYKEEGPESPGPGLDICEEEDCGREAEPECCQCETLTESSACQSAENNENTSEKPNENDKAN